jgi:tetratricopeptide (TPR) repeat protein
MMDSVAAIWWVPLGAVAAAAAAGLAAALYLAQQAKRSSCAPDEPADSTLAQREDDEDEALNYCMAHLRDLQQQQGRLQPEAYAQQMAAQQARAAALLRSRDSTAAQVQQARLRRAAQAPAPMVSYLQQRPQLRGALWGGGTVGVAALLYVFAVLDQTPGQVAAPLGAVPGSQASAAAGQTPAEGAPAATAPGNLPPGPMDAQTEQELQDLMEQLKTHPDDVPKLLRLAHLLLRGQMLREAKIVNDRALRYQPDSVEAKVHAAVLLASEGDTGAAGTQLDALTTAHRDFAEAWFFRGMLAMQAGDRARMLESFHAYLEVAPPGSQRDRIASLVGKAPS